MHFFVQKSKNVITVCVWLLFKRPFVGVLFRCSIIHMRVHIQNDLVNGCQIDGPKYAI